MSRRKKSRLKKQEKPRVIGLVILGLIAIAGGLVMALGRTPYYSHGGMGRFAKQKVIIQFSGVNASFMGWMVFVCGALCLYLA